MVDVKREQCFRILAAKLVEHTLVPALGQLVSCVQILREEAILIRNAKKVQDVHNHAEMRHEHNLGDIGCELLIAFNNTSPQLWRRLTHTLAVQLCEMKPQLDSFVQLKSFQFPDRDRADELLESWLTQ